MLARMLLHVIAATWVDINQTMNAASLVDRSCIVENMEDNGRPLFPSHRSRAICRSPGRENSTRIENLPAAGGIEGSAIQENAAAGRDSESDARSNTSASNS